MNECNARIQRWLCDLEGLLGWRCHQGDSYMDDDGFDIEIDGVFHCVLCEVKGCCLCR